MASRKMLLSIQFVANILFTDEAGVAMVSIVNFHNTHDWVDDNPSTTVIDINFDFP
jgi:ligand-binding SRPBCC domain-containing protein